MDLNKQNNWTLFSIFGIAYWFFGNLYEAIVFGPNWIIENLNHLKYLNAFFSNSSPTAYFIPFVSFLFWSDISSYKQNIILALHGKF